MAGQGGGEGHECAVQAGVAFVPDGQPAVAGEPGDGPFDDPPVPAEPVRGLDAAAGDTGPDTAGAEHAAQVGIVVALVGVQLVRTAPAGAAPGPDGGDGLDQGFQADTVVGVGGRHADGQGQPVAVGQGVDFAAGLAPVDRTRTGQAAPLFARTDAASAVARDQSINPLDPSWSSAATCNRRHNPALVQATNRRCAVALDTPNPGGRCRHAHPVVNTYTIAANTARASIGGVPPPCGRRGGGGINGAARLHNSSDTHCWINRSSTVGKIYHRRPPNRHPRHALSNGWRISATAVDPAVDIRHELVFEGALLREGHIWTRFDSGQERQVEVTPRQRLFLAGVGYSPDPRFTAPGRETFDVSDPTVRTLLRGQTDHGCDFMVDGVHGYGYVETGLGIHQRYRPE